MVNIKTLTLAVLATFSSLVAADPCQSDRLYCGNGLLAIGDYGAAIDEALVAADEPVDDDTRNNGLFLCANDGTGDISWDSTCEQCQDGGEEDDYC
ncbi:hypothetical protein BDW42DRAFT_191782 [Aspergillus taichungensis]|uniref:Uncharacterized protein n=1 Tax=Aspergillus taichungensis TaxID=482145 RepID=A0A2J5I2C8_9EURO|nr:hypothetical protein BDW42DRAFT_191782 [Aspergillus taichungensis]